MGSDDTACSGLFNCTRCGDCCKGYGGTYLTDADIEAIAGYLGERPERFTAHYTCRSGSGRLIIQGKDDYCIFWDKECTIHPVKPKMCRQWPFIRSILVDVANWRAMASTCPGMAVDAPEGRIRECVSACLKTGV